MRLPRTRSQSLFSLALIILATLLPKLNAANVTSNQLGPQNRGVHLVCTPSKVQFGKVAVGHSKTSPIAITNVGSSSITLSRVITAGHGFSIRGLALPLTLARGESVTFMGYFAPRFKGSTSGSVSFVTKRREDPDVMNGSLMLSGDGTDSGLLMVTPATLDFGATQIGSPVFKVGYLMAGDAAVTVSSAQSSDPEFILQNLSLPMTIPPGGVQPFTVAFEPQISGPVAATLSFQSDAGNSPTVQSLIGTGLSSGSHIVNLSWNASNSHDVIGYNVYRSLTSGGPYGQINTTLDPNTAFTDTSVSNGNTYYYVTTAVNSSDEESVYSNQAQATIPVN
jgi:hypothetical protein